MMMMASMAFFWGGLRCLQIGLQTREGFLGAGNIPRLEGADQTLVVCIGLAVVAKRLARRCWRIALQALHALLERGQGALGGGYIARLQSAADGIEIIDGLGQSVLVCALARSLVRVGRRSDTRYGVHSCFLFNLLLPSILALVPFLSAGIGRTLAALKRQLQRHIAHERRRALRRSKYSPAGGTNERHMLR